jgi:chromosome partitioning protein
MRMARKMTVAMKKGGSGKTTTTVNVAAALVLRGKRVLFVDLDPQANATIALGINPSSVMLPQVELADSTTQGAYPLLRPG